jgi:hypothetical protein
MGDDISELDLILGAVEKSLFFGWGNLPKSIRRFKKASYTDTGYQTCVKSVCRGDFVGFCGISCVFYFEVTWRLDKKRAMLFFQSQPKYRRG